MQLALILLVLVVNVVIAFKISDSEYTNEFGKNLVLIRAPSVNDAYYQDRFHELVDFYKVYADAVMGHDNIIVMADYATTPYLSDHLPDDVLLEVPFGDIWIRDFGLVRVSQPTMLKYLPEYLTQSNAEYIQNQFQKILAQNSISIKQMENGQVRSAGKLQVPQYSDLVIDGGNVVENRIDKAILSSRILTDNPDFDKTELASVVGKALNYTNVAIVTGYGNVNEDTTGHADGMLSFIDHNVIAIGIVEDYLLDRLLKELRIAFGSEVRTVILPSYFNDQEDPNIGFTSACGVHVNSLVTEEFIYMPVFGQDPANQQAGYTNENDDVVYNLVIDNTKKRVIKVPVPSKVCLLGGSVRCLSNQLKGPIADLFVQSARDY